MKIFKYIFLFLFFISFNSFAKSEDTNCFENTTCIYRVKTNNSNELYIQNLKNSDITVSWEITKSENIEISKSPKTIVIEPKKKVHFFSIYQKDDTKKWNYYYRYYTTIGTNKAKHDDNYSYELPYEKNLNVKVNQGFNSTFSHQGEFKYSIDFDLDEGSKVFASREGIVVDIKDNSNKGCSFKECANDGNFILIKHDDGTYAGYVHLKYKGSFVKVLDKVKKGQLIGLSGNTGWSSGAHLHFWVYKTIDGKTRESIPVRFDTNEGKKIFLEQNYYYSK